MPKILATLAILAITAFLMPPLLANAGQSPGARTDHSAVATDVSAHRRWHRRHYRGYYGRGPYWGPRPYYGYGYYRPYRRYWAPPPVLPLFPFGPWW